MTQENADIQPQAEPHIVKSHDIHIDADYADWIADIKSRYRSAQVKAAVKVNAEKLLFNWQLCRDLVQKKAEERWGAGVVEQVSLDLKREFPDADGFSTSNLWFMKRWYSFYTTNVNPKILQQFADNVQHSNQQTVSKLYQVGKEIREKILYQDGKEFPLPFALVPWRHHIEILYRCKSIDEALFYVGKTIEQGLSRDALINCIKANLYEHQGKIVNNFTDHLPALQSKLVQEVLKENYDFGFATVEHEIYDEAELEEALTKNVTDLLLELGTGFAFLGRQKELVVGGRSRKIDLLFYHIRLRCYVVCELKAKPFEPEFAGKLNYYVNAVDELLKTDDENPTIGLLVCSDMDKIDVQWSFKGISTPMGVATYNNIRIKDALPSQELLAERVRLLQKELQETKRLMGRVANIENKESGRNSTNNH
ncbi:MAG: PDDEXK nuclease domain-containing protein [Candidatus Onthomorpha sp.]|nr:PDDEXK nuclease domain-containing protein [Bacteroidales bacterium]MDD7485379.1 PDDEXK nuclease domain-containing protein [Bacteroidales bacterium]MDY5698497.1 PDDEXK nuclease domain-containing protein [Candidatus Onthomorpha sp.]